MWSRIYLIPLLQAEEDRDQVRRYWADKEREKVLLGTDIKIYNSDRYVEWVYEVGALGGYCFGREMALQNSTGFGYHGFIVTLLTASEIIDLCGLHMQ